MKVTQEKLPASQIGLEIEVPPEMSKKAYERVIQEFTRSANIPGFRKGKVPRQVLIQRIGSLRIKAAAVEELVENSLKEAVKQENINALGNFQLRSSFDDLISQFEPDQALTFSASVDVPPEVTLSEYSGLKVQAEEIKPDPERVEKVLHSYQEQTATLVPVEARPAQMKDVAVVDFKGVIPSDDPDQEPMPIPGGEAQDFQLELEEGRFIPGFIDGIVGMSPGETKEIQAQFPETYPQEDVAGKMATFTVTLKELKEKELPELDDDFAQEVSEFATLAELRESLESRFAKEAEDKTRANQEEAILKELLNHVEAEIPETLIDREVTYMLNQTAMQLQNQGIDVRQLFTQELIARLKEQSRPEAITRIKRTLALGEIAKRESIEVDPEEVSAKSQELLNELADQGVDRNIDPDRLQSVVTEDLLKEKIMNWLIEHSTIELVPEGTLTQAEEEDMVEDVEEATAPTPAEPSLEESEPAPVEAATATVDIPAETVTEPEAEAQPEAPAPKRKRTTKSAATKMEDPPAADVTPAEAGNEDAPAPKARKSTKKPKQTPAE